tara:strand:- start:390 stop:614 length:225 start_codon:yes stop_codon:yes gene_type:complete
MNSRKRKLLKLKVRQTRVVTPVAPVVPVKQRAKKDAQVPETVTEKEASPPVAEEPTPKQGARKSIEEKKNAWKL